jgi:hypothetical protein
MDDDICIGIILVDNQLEVTTRQAGREETGRLFMANPKGIAALTQFVASFRAPVRAAVAGATAVSIGLALAAIPESEVFMVSPTVAAKSLDLARYAERAI